MAVAAGDPPQVGMPGRVTEGRLRSLPVVAGLTADTEAGRRFARLYQWPEPLDEREPP
jgi:hypothetical protein